MHLAALVITCRIDLQTGLDSFVVNDNRFPARRRIHHYLQDIQQLARVTAGISEQCFRLVDFYILLRKYFIIVQCPVQQAFQIIDIQWFQDEDLTPGEEGIDNFERRVLGSSSYQHHSPVLDSAQQRILLRLVEPVDFINEKNRRTFPVSEH